MVANPKKETQVDKVTESGPVQTRVRVNSLLELNRTYRLQYEHRVTIMPQLLSTVNFRFNKIYFRIQGKMYHESSPPKMANTRTNYTEEK